MPVTRSSFTNIRGKVFDLVSELAYKKGELFGNLGHFITETDEIYIYQSFNNLSVAYRIYKGFADYGFNAYYDAKLIQTLNERKKNIKLTRFPSGVVTLDNRIIGQQIPYYNNYINLKEYCLQNQNINPISLYKNILNALKELYDNGILYFDIHPKNFLINPNDINNKIEIIDFDSTYIKFDKFNFEILQSFFDNYLNTIYDLNNSFSIADKIDGFSKINNFEDAYNQLNEMEKQYRKIK